MLEGSGVARVLRENSTSLPHADVPGHLPASSRTVALGEELLALGVGSAAFTLAAVISPGT